jgi:hypothetical protein
MIAPKISTKHKHLYTMREALQLKEERQVLLSTK